jgi:hypothetical protein
MAPPPKNKAAACQGRGGDKQKTTTHEYISAAPSTSPLIDRHGHLHSEAVLRNWSPAALTALGVRRLDGTDL